MGCGNSTKNCEHYELEKSHRHDQCITLEEEEVLKIALSHAIPDKINLRVFRFPHHEDSFFY